MIRWLDDGTGDAREEAVALLPDHELLVTPRGQVEGRELYQVIRDTPREKGSAAELEAFVRDLMARNPPLVRTLSILPATPGAERRPAAVLVQDSLTPGADAEKLLADGNVVALVALSGRGGDAERPRSGNWMNNTRAWLVGRNLPAMHAAEINAAVAEMAGRADVDPARITRARVRRRGHRIAAGGSGESANRIRVARPHAPQRARGDRQPDSHEPARRRDPGICVEVGSGGSARAVAAPSGHLEGPDRLDG